MFSSQLNNTGAERKKEKKKTSWAITQCNFIKGKKKKKKLKAS